MNTTVKALRAALKAVSPIFKGHRSMLPVLGCVLIDGATLTGNNLTFEMVAPFDVETPATPFKAVIDYKALTAALKAGKPNDQVHLTFEAHSPLAIPASKETGPAQPEMYAGLLTVRTNGAMSQTLKTNISPDDFPQSPQRRGTAITRASLDGKTLQAAVRRVAFAAATDESQPVLTGILTKFTETEVTLAAADGFRLAVDQAPYSTAVPNFTGKPTAAIVPALAWQAIAPYLAGEVNIAVNDLGAQEKSLHVHISTKSASITVCAIEGSYPDVWSLIPKPAKTPNLITVNRADLLAAVNAVKSTAKAASESCQTRLEHTPDRTGLEVIATSAEQGEARVAVAATVGGLVPPAVMYNGLFLSEVLAALDGETVTLQILTAEKPMLLTDAAQPNYKYVLMPMYLGR